VGAGLVGSAAGLAPAHHEADDPDQQQSAGTQHPKIEHKICHLIFPFNRSKIANRPITFADFSPTKTIACS
jgi:hypothetical protein